MKKINRASMRYRSGTGSNHSTCWLGALYVRDTGACRPASQYACRLGTHGYRFADGIRWRSRTLAGGTLWKI